jgi:glycopeptide antibiotics resistance protein
MKEIAIAVLLGLLIVLPAWGWLRASRLRSMGVVGRPIHWWREVLLTFLVVYAELVVVLTLLPLKATSGSSASVNVIPFRTILTCVVETLHNPGDLVTRCIANILGNLLLLFPLGVLGPLIFHELLSPRRLIVVALAIGTGIESVQLIENFFGASRTVDIDDVILDLVGACAGLVIILLVRRKLPHIFPSPTVSPSASSTQPQRQLS